MNRLLFWIIWPLLWVYTPITRRSRMLIIKNDKVLLVKNRLGPNKWQLPGGGVKFGESAQSAAERELLEELNLAAGDTKALNDSFIVCRQAGLLFRLHFYSCSIKDENELQLNHEIQAITWRSIDDLHDCLTEVETALKLAETV